MYAAAMRLRSRFFDTCQWAPLHAGLEAYHDKVVNPTGNVYIAY